MIKKKNNGGIEMKAEIKKAIKKVEILERVKDKSEFLNIAYMEACSDAESLIYNR